MELWSPDRWQRLASLFEEAIDLPIHEHASFLENLVEDAALRTELTRLLLAHDRAAGFLDELDTGRAAALVREVGDGLRAGDQVGPYTVVRSLGRGGMGVVWLAHDPRLDRPVALKLLPVHRTGDPAARRRLAEEAKAASALDHPHIATIYDIGEAPDGRVFIAMAYCEGESLRQRLERGPLPIGEAVSVAAQLADALASAHAAGIVHRDLKPGNILLTPRGGAKLVDFGVAKLPSMPATAGPTGGTPPYMSPEQSLAEELDGRSDLWSLGVVLYEMVAGRRPFAGADDGDLLRAIRTGTPPPLQLLRPEVPDRLAGIVERCLAKTPADRFPDAAALRDALRSVAESGPSRGRRGRGIAAALAVSFVALLAAGVRLLVGTGTDVQAAMDNPTAGWTQGALAAEPTWLAVLPLANLGSDPDDEFFADGLTEELIARLAGLGHLRVIARTSVLQYRDPDRNLSAIAADLGVARVLEGGVRRVGNRARVTVQLVDVGTRETVWSDAFDVSLADILTIQREIAERVAESLQVRLDPGDRRTLAGLGTIDPDAYIAYLRGRHFLNRRTADGLHHAVESFEDAIRRDERFADAHASLAEAYLHLGNYGFMPSEHALPQARRAAARALDLPTTPANAYSVLALVHVADRDFGRAERAFHEALVRRPNDATTRHLYGFFLGIQGRTEDALREVRAALELDPLALPIAASLARLLTYAGQTAEAIEHLETAIRLEPGYPWTWFGLGLAHAGQHEYDEAIAALRQALDLAPGQPRARASLAAVHALSGAEASARRVAEEMEAGADPVAHAFELAVIHDALGDVDRAFAHLLATRWSSETLFSLRTDPLLTRIRSDSRYRELLRSLALTP